MRSAFVGGKNLFHAAREAFGYTTKLPRSPSRFARGRDGNWRRSVSTPDSRCRRQPQLALRLDPQARGHGAAGHRRVQQASPIRNRRVALPDGTQNSFLTGEEKGIDVRIALDVIALAHRREYEVALVFS